MIKARVQNRRGLICAVDQPPGRGMRGKALVGFLARLEIPKPNPANCTLSGISSAIQDPAHSSLEAHETFLEFRIHASNFQGSLIGCRQIPTY